MRDTPSEGEFTAILESIGAQKENRDAKDSVDFVKFMGLAGVGNSEAAALKWKHVDFDREIIRLYRNKTDTGYEIPLFPSVRPLLSDLWDKSDKLPEDRVFKIKNAKKALMNVCKRLQLPHYTQRSLRRMFITRCIYKSVPVPDVALWQGHRDNGATIFFDSNRDWTITSLASRSRDSIRIVRTPLQRIAVNIRLNSGRSASVPVNASRKVSAMEYPFSAANRRIVSS